MHYENHPNGTYDGQIYDGSNHLRPKYDPIKTPLRIKHECTAYGHDWGIMPVTAPPNSSIDSLDIPCIKICGRCEKVDAKNYNAFAKENNLTLYPEKQEEKIKDDLLKNNSNFILSLFTYIFCPSSRNK